MSAATMLGNTLEAMRGSNAYNRGRAVGEAVRGAPGNAWNWVRQNPGKAAALGVGAAALGTGLSMAGGMAQDAIDDANRENTGRYSDYDDGLREMDTARQQMDDVANNQARMNNINFDLFNKTTQLQREMGRDTMEQDFYTNLALNKQKLKADEAANVLQAATQNNQTAGQVLASAAANSWIK